MNRTLALKKLELLRFLDNNFQDITFSAAMKMMASFNIYVNGRGDRNLKLPLGLYTHIDKKMLKEEISQLETRLSPKSVFNGLEIASSDCLN